MIAVLTSYLRYYLTLHSFYWETLCKLWVFFFFNILVKKKTKQQQQQLNLYSQSNLDKMVDCAKEVCPYITSTQVRYSTYPLTLSFFAVPVRKRLFDLITLSKSSGSPFWNKNCRYVSFQLLPRVASFEKLLSNSVREASESTHLVVMSDNINCYCCQTPLLPNSLTSGKAD